RKQIFRDEVSMMKFLCPTGHPLNAPESLAGKPSRCPRCNTPFIVPQPSEAGDGGDLATGGSSRITTAGGSGTNLVQTEELFYFPCPNGTKRNGPPTLKGKAGQCPECGARFLIPTDEKIAAAGEEVIGDNEHGSAAGDTGAGGIGLNRSEDFGIDTPPAGAA